MVRQRVVRPNFNNPTDQSTGEGRKERKRGRKSKSNTITHLYLSIGDVNWRSTGPGYIHIGCSCFCFINIWASIIKQMELWPTRLYDFLSVREVSEVRGNILADSRNFTYSQRHSKVPSLRLHISFEDMDIRQFALPADPGARPCSSESVCT